MTAVTDVAGLIGWHTRRAIVSMSEDGGGAQELVSFTETNPDSPSTGRTQPSVTDGVRNAKRPEV